MLKILDFWKIISLELKFHRKRSWNGQISIKIGHCFLKWWIDPAVSSVESALPEHEVNDFIAARIAIWRGPAATPPGSSRRA